MSAREKLIKVLDAKRKWPDAPETADAILAAMPEIVGAMVKPLVWTKSECFKAFRSGAYVVQHEHYPDGSGVWVFGVGSLISEHPSEQDAKAAAEAHHRAQVLSSLDIK